jgi:hypothetical protein
MFLARPRLYFDECLVSYLIRVSERNGFRHLGHLLHHAGLGWKNNRAPIHEILSGKFDLSPFLAILDLPNDESRVAPLYKSFQRVIDTPYLIVKYPKVCPDCLDELGYCKFEWSLLPILACVKHKKMLVDVSATGKRLAWYRQHLNKFDEEPERIKPHVGLARPNALRQSMYIESLLSGRELGHVTHVILQGLSFRESLSLIHFIAHYQVRLLGKSFNPLIMNNSELGQCYQDVWAVLQDWPDGFYALLSQYIDQPMSNKGIGGLNKHYRDIYERLHRQNANKGIARIKTEFDRYIEAYWPGVLEPERIQRIKFTASTRNIISKKEAANIIGSRYERINKLVQLEKLSVVVFKGKAHYLRDQVEALAMLNAMNWSMEEACEALQITRYQLRQLLDAEVIPVHQKPDNLNRDWIIDKAECRKLVANLRNDIRKAKLPEKVLSMAGIQRQGLSIVQLITGMRAGQIEYGICADMEHPDSLKQFVAFKSKEIA